MYKVSEIVLPIYINGQCPIIKTCSDVTLNLSSKDSKCRYSEFNLKLCKKEKLGSLKTLKHINILSICSSSVAGVWTL